MPKQSFLIDNKMVQAEPSIAYRYWRIKGDHQLEPPIWDGDPWAPGFNRAACHHSNVKQHQACSNGRCGFYAFAPYEDVLRSDNDYFESHTGHVSGAYNIVGAVILLNAVGDSKVRAPYAHIACLTLKPDAGQTFTERAKKVAIYYNVPLVEATTMYATAEQKVQELMVYRRRWPARWFSRVREPAVTD